jgi:DNA-binding CsgD family transcriptional regulator
VVHSGVTMERRKYVRIPFGERGKAQALASRESGTIYSTNISREGLCFYSSASFALGSEAKVELELNPLQGGPTAELLRGCILWKREWGTFRAYGAQLSTPLNRVETPRFLELIAPSEGSYGSGVAKRAGAEDGQTSLTKREYDIIRLIGRGVGNREIAQRLSISIKTVETHRANIYSKLKVHNAVQLLLAIEAGGVPTQGQERLPSPPSDFDE